jgi:hypothetical protein
MMRRLTGWLRGVTLLVAIVLAPACSPEPSAPEPAAREHVATSAQPQMWLQQDFTLHGDAPDGRFGYSVALSGGTLVVGAPYESASDGAAYVFERSGTSWGPGTSLVVPSGPNHRFIGHSVAISKDTIVVGAPGDGTNANYVGAVHVFVRRGGSFPHARQLIRFVSVQEADAFGASVAISGDSIAVGAPNGLYGTGSTWLYQRSGTHWLLKASTTSGVPNDLFGSAVAVSGNTVLTGAPGNGNDPNYPGAAYVHTWDGASLNPHVTLYALDGVHADAFGASVALSGQTAVVGAPLHDGLLSDVMGSGAAYVFAPIPESTTSPLRLLADDRAVGDALGSVAVSGGTIVVGAPRHRSQASGSGAVYAFAGSGDGFPSLGTLPPSDATLLDAFGFSVAVDGRTAVVGAPSTRGPMDTFAGAASVFVLLGSKGEPCVEAGDCGSGWCVGGVCCDDACSGPCAACTKSLGASADGACTSIAGLPGDPSCGLFLCDGQSHACPTACASDDACVGGHHCAPDGTCKPGLAIGDACDADAGSDCKVAGCKVCGAGACIRGVCCAEDCGPDQGSYYACAAGPGDADARPALVLAAVMALAGRARRRGRRAS